MPHLYSSSMYTKIARILFYRSPLERWMHLHHKLLDIFTLILLFIEKRLLTNWWQSANGFKHRKKGGEPPKQKPPAELDILSKYHCWHICIIDLHQSMTSVGRKSLTWDKKSQLKCKYLSTRTHKILHFRPKVINTDQTCWSRPHTTWKQERAAQVTLFHDVDRMNNMSGAVCYQGPKQRNKLNPGHMWFYHFSACLFTYGKKCICLSLYDLINKVLSLNFLPKST